MASFFLSDVHLSHKRPGITRLFCAFLSAQARDAEALYILGDLFDYWAGDDDRTDPLNATVCQSLRDLTQSGVPVFFMAGNRDFLIREAFSQASGMIVLPDPTLIELAGKPTLLMHGDTLCTEDHAYQAFREQVRSNEWQETFLALPLTQRKAHIATLRELSDTEKSNKAMESMDVSKEAVSSILREYGYPQLIHGHTHRPALHIHEVDGHTCKRWVLADWHTQGSYLACDARGCIYTETVVQ